MPEYLTPGVYLEETNFRSKSIEGVATSTFGMAGVTTSGPVPYVLTNPSVVMVPSPPLVTSFTEFERAFALKASLHDEAQAPVSPTGRRTTADAEAKLRTLVASVEGASRFAIRLGLLDPGQVRAIWSEAIGRGLYDGWDGGQSAYAVGLGGAQGAPRLPRSQAPAERQARDPKQPPNAGGQGAAG